MLHHILGGCSERVVWADVCNVDAHNVRIVLDMRQKSACAGNIWCVVCTFHPPCHFKRVSCGSPVDLQLQWHFKAACSSSGLPARGKPTECLSRGKCFARQPEHRSSCCARHARPSDAGAWGTGATLLSFVAALVHFTIEVLVYKTMSLKSAANPLVIAGAPLVSVHPTCRVPACHRWP